MYRYRYRYRYVKALAYASSANLGPGFDVFGIALDAYYDEVELFTIEGMNEISIEVISDNNTTTIPTAIEENSAGLALRTMIQDYGINDGLRVRIRKGVPAGYGLGSSAASAVAAVRAFDAMYNLGLDDNSLVRYSALGEVASANTVHYDNVAASMLGGFVIVRVEPFSITRFDPPEGLVLCVATPLIQVPKGKTGVARSVLPTNVPFSAMVSNVANASMLVAGFAKRDVKMIADAIRDSVVEPARKHLIPYYDDIKSNALSNGALGVTISGAGPSILAVTDSRDKAYGIADGIEHIYSSIGVRCSVKVCGIAEGAKVIECID